MRWAGFSRLWPLDNTSPLLEAENNAALVPETVLSILEAAGQTSRESVGRAELGPQIVHLRHANCKMLADSKVKTAPELHCERIRARDPRGNSSADGNGNAGAEARMCCTEHRVRKH